MSIRIYVPFDSTALALGADDVAVAIAAEAKQRGIDIEIVRNGTRGLLWLEPLVEVATPGGRIGFGPVDEDDVPALFDAGFHLGQSSHALALGPVEQIPYLAKQSRLTFARAGVTDPLSLADYEAHDGYKGLRNALGMEPAAIVASVTASGLRGRGGAAFPDRDQMEHGAESPARRKSTSSAMPTKAIRAPSPTASSWKAIPSC
jgi:formate dehydrogenase iron-sulfur subunit